MRFNDLSTAENQILFEQDEDEDYQFIVYKEMHKLLKNAWSEFQPKTNVLWLFYLIDKLLYWKKKSDFQRYDPVKRENLKKLYLVLRENFASCTHVVSSSRLLKI